ncbi:zinc-binding dehydrogenase [Fictibacillus terranigra]|uniref:Zinc-binding dehydrogenase n=1 Tax=Fictibacillus terranigra TaxID=3058424 RepID=A0ABT8EBJ1_9BACL|nr:zinc-binding dehydrogenase [Fictibacillus sp. CENA-BCM004]MDN4075300.1 zinc-binding dehydrogenase [Fictibacillus sp. CENA-BCM004]
MLQRWLGLLTIQALKAAGASGVLVVELSEERRNLARKIFADVILNPAEVDAVQEIKRLTNDLGVEVSFDAAGVEPTLNANFKKVSILKGNQQNG